MIESSEKNHPTAPELAEREKVASRKIDLSGFSWPLAAIVACYVLALLCPQVTDVAGWKVLTLSSQADQADVKITEYALAWLCFLCVGVLTTATLIWRSTVTAHIAWILSAIGTFVSVLALWLRQTRPAAEEVIAAGLGEYLLVISIVGALFCYSRVSLRRSAEQEAVAKERAELKDLDDVAYAQNAALVRQQRSVGDDNPLLRDDRRARAAARRKCQD